MTDLPHTDAPGPSTQAGGLALIHALLASRRILWRYPLVIAGVVTAVSFLFPNYYRSTVVILPPESDFQSMAQPSGGLQSLFSGEMALPMMATPSDVLAAVLTSRTVRDSVVARLDLAERWDLKPYQASGRLWKVTTVDVSETGIISASVVDSDRFFTDTIANEMVAAADRLNRAIANTKARRTREFVETRLAETRADLAIATDSLEAFQTTNRTVALDVEIAALVENAAQLRAQLTSDEIELAVLEGTLSPQHHRIRSLQRSIEQRTEKLRELEEPVESDSGRGFMGMGLQELPHLAQLLAARLRDVRVADALLGLLTQQYEHARIQERRDTPTFSVLDPAVGGGIKARPRRSLIALGTLVSTFGFLVVFVLGQAYMQQLKTTDPSRHRALTELWQMARPRRRSRATTGEKS